MVTVTYSTVDGTAVADADFTPTSGTLTFNPNQTTKTIRVPILRDTVHEPSETFTVELDDPPEPRWPTRRASERSPPTRHRG